MESIELRTIKENMKFAVQLAFDGVAKAIKGGQAMINLHRTCNEALTKREATPGRTSGD